MPFATRVIKFYKAPIWHKQNEESLDDGVGDKATDNAHNNGPANTDGTHSLFVQLMQQLVQVKCHNEQVMGRVQLELEQMATRTLALTQRLHRLSSDTQQLIVPTTKQIRTKSVGILSNVNGAEPPFVSSNNSVGSTNLFSAKQRPARLQQLYEAADKSGQSVSAPKVIMRRSRKRQQSTQTDIPSINDWSGAVSPTPNMSLSVGASLNGSPMACSTPARKISVDISGSLVRRMASERHRAVYACNKEIHQLTSTVPLNANRRIPPKVPQRSPGTRCRVQPPGPLQTFNGCLSPTEHCANYKRSSIKSSVSSRTSPKSVRIVTERKENIMIDSADSGRGESKKGSPTAEAPPTEDQYDILSFGARRQHRSVLSSLYGSMRQAAIKSKSTLTHSKHSLPKNLDQSQVSNQSKDDMSEIYATFKRQLRYGKWRAMLRRSVSLRFGQRNEASSSLGRDNVDGKIVNRRRHSQPIIRGPMEDNLKHKVQLPISSKSQVLHLASSLRAQDQHHCPSQRPTSMISSYSLDLQQAQQVNGWYRRGYKLDFPESGVSKQPEPSPWQPAKIEPSSLVFTKQAPSVHASAGSVYSCDQDGYFTSMHMDSGCMTHCKHSPSDSGTEHDNSPLQQLCTVQANRAFPPLYNNNTGDSSHSTSPMPPHSAPIHPVAPFLVPLQSVPHSTSTLPPKSSLAHTSCAQQCSCDNQVLDHLLLQRFEREVQVRTQIRGHRLGGPKDYEHCVPNTNSVIRTSTQNTYFTLPSLPKPSPHQQPTTPPCTCHKH